MPPSLHVARSSKTPSLLAFAVLLGWTTLLTAGEPRRLTTDGRWKTDPIFVAGGKEIVYTLQDKATQFNTYKLSLADGTNVPLDASAIASQVSPSYSADEKVYAYVQNDGNLHVRLVIFDRERGTKAEYEPGTGFASVQCLSVAPSGKNLVFAFPETGGTQQIFALDVDGKNRRALTHGDAFDDCPRFSPDGKRIAFVSSREGNFDICVMSSDGTNVHRLTEHESFDSRPAWSPDGKRLVFTSLRDGNYELYTMNADGGEVRRITDHPERDDYGWWHPNGREIAAVCERRGKHDLYLLDAR